MTGALDGIRVLDLCIILAGPTCGRTLAEYGADVIKIDPEHRRPALNPWLDVGRGKRSMCIDIKKERGLEAFCKLADTADVVLQGFRKGVAERLGIGYEQLSGRNQGVVYVSINAFGRDGPWSMRPGFDQNAQAATGMQLRNGGSGEPGPPPYTFNDYGTGIMAAYGVMLALLERERTGVGQQVSTSLALTASTFSSQYMVDYDGHEPSEVSGPEAKGTGPLSRLYRTSDGWLALSAELDGDWKRLTKLEPFAALSGIPLTRPSWRPSLPRARQTSGHHFCAKPESRPLPTAHWLTFGRCPRQGRRSDSLTPPSGVRYSRARRRCAETERHTSQSRNLTHFRRRHNGHPLRARLLRRRHRLHADRGRDTAIRRPAAEMNC